jgi:hypothetical protein
LSKPAAVPSKTASSKTASSKTASSKTASSKSASSLALPKPSSTASDFAQNFPTPRPGSAARSEKSSAGQNSLRSRDQFYKTPFWPINLCTKFHQKNGKYKFIFVAANFKI